MNLSDPSYCAEHPQELAQLIFDRDEDTSEMALPNGRMARLGLSPEDRIEVEAHVHALTEDAHMMGVDVREYAGDLMVMIETSDDVVHDADGVLNMQSAAARIYLGAAS